MTVDLVWLADGFREPQRRRFERCARDKGRHDHREFITTEPGQDTVRSERPFQSLGHLLQQQIADAMAERIVDRLETIEVEEQHGKFISPPRGRSLPADLIKCGTEHAPVG